MKQKTLLAIGAHAGDVEVTCGSVLAKHAAAGDRVVLLHLTLGEGGNPGLSPAVYGDQKRREAIAVAEAMRAEVQFGPYRDGELPESDDARLYVADRIRQIRPTHILTHWRSSMHKDHSVTHRIVNDAVLLASLEGVSTGHERHQGVQRLLYSENWEDSEGFTPYHLVDVSGEFEDWRKWIVLYEFIRGGISSFAYLDYYTSLARMRGARAGVQYAVAFDIDPFEKRLLAPFLP